MSDDNASIIHATLHVQHPISTFIFFNCFEHRPYYSELPVHGATSSELYTEGNVQFPSRGTIFKVINCL